MKKIIVLLISIVVGIGNVKAITSDGVTYDNQGNTEVLTDTLDGLLREADKYKTGGTVTANQMLKGATGYAKGELVTGTIESKGAETYTPGTTNQTINAGQYLSGAQTIKGDANLTGANIAAGKTIFGVSGTFTSDANAAAGHILSGKTAYVNGSKVTGTIESKGATTYTPGTSSQTIKSGQYLSGNQTIVGDADLISGNILSGVNIFGVNGSHTARNHTFKILKADQTLSDTIIASCSNSYSVTISRAGRIFVWMASSSHTGDADKNNLVVCKNGTCSSSFSMKDDIRGVWNYWEYDVEVGDRFEMSAKVESTKNGVASCGIYVVYVS